MRRAEWRRRADDPKTLLSWWWRGVVAHPVFREQRLVLFAILPFVVCGLVGLAGGGWGWFALATANLAFANGRSRKENDPLAPLLPEPAPEGQFRATVEYRRDGSRMGRDEMALAVVDGWLVGEGVRSRFALRSADVREARTGYERMDHRERLFLTDGSEIRLRGITFDTAAKATLDGWRRSEAAAGEPTFPPARAHPQEEARWLIWVAAGLLLMAALPVGLLLSKGIVADLVAYALFAVGVVVGIVGAARRHDLSVESLKAMREAPERRRSGIEATRLDPDADASVTTASVRDVLSPRPPLEDRSLGEGESVRA